MADSLSDDLAIDENFSLHSDASQEGHAVQPDSDTEAQFWDNQSVISHQDQDQDEHRAEPRIKGNGQQDGRDGKGGNQTANENKKRKRKQNEKARKAKKAEETKQSKSISIATQPKSYQADYLYNKMKKSLDKLSQMELDELRIKEEVLEEVEFRKERSNENLPEFLNLALPSLSDSVEALSRADSSLKQDSLGSPLICIITGNALRATDLARSLRKLLPTSTSSKEVDPRPSKKKSKPNPTKHSNQDSTATATATATKSTDSNPSKTPPLTVAKLFSRHLKMSDQIGFLKTSRTPFAVGTPNRVLSLIENESLKLSEMKYLVLDLTWLDSKEMNLLDVKENRDEVFRLLTSAKLREQMKAAKIKVICW